MGTSSRLVAHLNKWPLLGMPVWPGNDKDGRIAAWLVLADSRRTALGRASAKADYLLSAPHPRDGQGGVEDCAVPGRECVGP
jgi:hypothetical protein